MGDMAYVKEYLPGYTGHVPKKNDIFGCTQGDINRILTNKPHKPSNFDIDGDAGRPQFAKRTFYSRPPKSDNFGAETQYGNKSRVGENWIGGPTNNLKAQHVPGYQGYVPNLKSENLFGKSFSKVTGSAINQEFIKGSSLPPKERFKTSHNQEFNKDNFRRIRDSHDPAELRDQEHAANFNDAEFKGIEVQRRNIYLDMPTVGYQGFRSMYRAPTSVINHRKDPFFNINPMKPRLKPCEAQSSQAFQTMSNGFQTAVMSTKNRQEAGLPDNQELKLPIAGYTGHRMGYKSQNFHGKNFRDCAIQSRFVQKMMQ